MLETFEFEAVRGLGAEMPSDPRLRRPAARRSFWRYRSASWALCTGLTSGPYAEFIAWADDVPTVVGRRLDLPWWNFAAWPDPLYHLLDGTEVVVCMRGRWTFALAVGGTEVMTVATTSLFNQVTVSCGDRTIGVFSPISRGFRGDLEGLDQLQFQVLLIIVGSRLPVRARRGCKFWLPLVRDPPQPLRT